MLFLCIQLIHLFKIITNIQHEYFEVDGFGDCIFRKQTVNYTNKHGKYLSLALALFIETGMKLMK